MHGMMLKRLKFKWGLHNEGIDRLLAVTIWHVEYHATCGCT